MTKLSQPLLNQGYYLFFDNFYSSVTLVKDLFQLSTPACGTTAENRKGYPKALKGAKAWARRQERGDVRWERNVPCLSLQWKDNRPVTILSSLDNANDFVMVSRKVKVGPTWRSIFVKQPKAIEQYNKYMNGVDLSDQLLSKHNVLRKCVRWWKTLFFHMIDIAAVNSYILFQLHRANNLDNAALKRPANYCLGIQRGTNKKYSQSSRNQ